MKNTPAPAYRLRPYEPEDLPDVHAVLAQPRATWGTLQTPLLSVEQRRRKWAVSAPTVFLVAASDAPETPRILGSASLDVADGRRRHTGSIGMAVHDDFAGRGIGRRLLVALLDHADRWLNLARVELTVYADNATAIALYESTGFVREGLLRRFAFRDGQFVDALSMARLADLT